MKRIVLVFILIWMQHLSIYAEENRDAGRPSIGGGMEIRKVKGFNLLVPKDARVWKEGDVLKVEDVTEYSASRFIKIENRLEKIDATLANLQNQIDELKEMIKVTKEAK